MKYIVVLMCNAITKKYILIDKGIELLKKKLF